MQIYYVSITFGFFFWLSRKNCRAVGKNYSGGKIFRAYSRVPSQKFVSPYAYEFNRCKKRVVETVMTSRGLLRKVCVLIGTYSNVLELMNLLALFSSVTVSVLLLSSDSTIFTLLFISNIPFRTTLTCVIKTTGIKSTVPENVCNI